MEYEYRCAEIPANLFSKKGKNVAAKALKNLIVQGAVDGFEFYRVDTFSVERPAGCLSFGGVHVTTYNVVTFRRPVVRGALEKDAGETNEG